MTPTHSLDSLSTFIVNVRKMDDLDSQIKQREGLLTNLEQLEEIYETLGNEAMLDKVTEQYNQTELETLVLKLKRNELERKLLMFQLNSLLEN